jgi:hypothetical protein
MFGKVKKKKDDKNKSSVLDLILLLEDAVAELKAAEINYNNSYNSYQEDVFFFQIQAAKARITLITNNNKKLELNKDL